MYDVKCDELARHFLRDVGRDKDELAVQALAQAIQDIIEDEMHELDIAVDCYD
jgi:hypothetical protein